MSAALLPCPFCGNQPTAYPRTCDRRTPYNPAHRAFPLVRCRCGATMDGDDWTGVETAIDKWNKPLLARTLPAADTIELGALETPEASTTISFLELQARGLFSKEEQLP